ncbi:MAG: Sec-independent protein translocase protein TatB [Thiobacillus sp.]|nr:Sec-independent protein translocase protein TatB [Gammaproteobacteria bacterium]MDO9008529.1 Sec-independent protein translocase protein TatB [Thiobacillus sp.]
MFDIGFSEMVVVGVVALIVIGPERLPKVARTAGHLYGRLQRYVSSVKSDISQEIQLDEIRRAGQDFKESIQSAASDVGQQATVVDDYLRNEINSVNQGLTSITLDAEQAELNPVKLETPAQQSLPLDAPDQNAQAFTPSAVVETARVDHAEKSA